MRFIVLFDVILMLKSVLFSPVKVRGLEIKNRFMRSATHEGYADSNDKPNSRLKKIICNLADNEVGLIVPGYVYPIKHGKASIGQCGVETYNQVQAWKDVIDYCHSKGSKIFIQVCHAGGRASEEATGVTPMAPTGGIIPGTITMKNETIEEIIDSYIHAALRIQRAGADGIQIHAAHCYLLAEFLSPLENRRNDKWGGSLDNRVRIVKEIASEIRKVVSPDFVVSIKMNGRDDIKNGVTPEMAAEYIKRLPMIDHFEISAGCNSEYKFGFAHFNTPNKNLFKKIFGKQYETIYKEALIDHEKMPYQEGYNVQATKTIHKLVPEANLAVCGGLNSVNFMEKIINENVASMVSLSRPFIREPNLVRKIHEGKIQNLSCKYCNLCLINGGKGLKCHNW